MKSNVRLLASAAVLVALVLGATATTVAAETEGPGKDLQVSLLGGVQILNKNDTGIPDQFVNVPIVGSLGYALTPIVSVDGEVSWLVPLKQQVDLATGSSVDRKTPDILTYQANVRAHWPTTSVVTPYLVGGLGALTVLESTDADRVPNTAKSQTMFALNFGAGLDYALPGRLSLRADFREFVAFPGNDAPGLSSASGADALWMERGTAGIAFHF